MRDLAIPCIVMRGGTSRGLFFRREDLPADDKARDRVLVAAVGGPDPRQVDGIGGADLLLSKIVVLSPSARTGVDIDVTFGSVAPGRATPAYGANCGNLIAAAALYAAQEHLVATSEGQATVRMYNTDSDSIIEGRLGGAEPAGRAEICRLAGMPASGTWVDLDFLAPTGTAQEKLLPTGNPRDRIRLEGGLEIHLSLIDCGAMYVFIQASQLGMDAAKITAEVQNHASAMKLFESIRGRAAVLAGLVHNPEDALTQSPAVPKLGLVGPAASYILEGQTAAVEAGAMDLASRIISTQKYHQAYAVTGAIATAAAAAVEGSVVAQVAPAISPGADGWTQLRIGHPTGVIACSVHATGTGAAVTIDRARIGRTARAVMAGEVLVPAEQAVPAKELPAQKVSQETP